VINGGYGFTVLQVMVVGQKDTNCNTNLCCWTTLDKSQCKQDKIL